MKVLLARFLFYLFLVTAVVVLVRSNFEGALPYLGMVLLVTGLANWRNMYRSGPGLVLRSKIFIFGGDILAVAGLSVLVLMALEKVEDYPYWQFGWVDIVAIGMGVLLLLFLSLYFSSLTGG